MCGFVHCPYSPAPFGASVDAKTAQEDFLPGGIRASCGI